MSVWNLLLGLCMTISAQEDRLPTPMPVGPLRSQWKVQEMPRDIHSYGNPQELRVKHLELDLGVNFDQKVLEGRVVLHVQRMQSDAALLKLDTRDLEIQKIEWAADGKSWKTTTFTLGPRDTILGSVLEIQFPREAFQIRIHYRTKPTASGLQWLNPAQTAGKRYPFMFTQSQAIHARSWVPCQDSPGVRVTYEAIIRTPRNLRAVMGAEQQGRGKADVWHFKMPQAIPSYLLALAVGDLQFKSLGPRSGVYAEPSVLPKAAKELEDTEKMIEATEKLFGPYRWGRYDVLILPPSFPFGGMENPRLTFATPTILAGDKSLVALIAHELAHSWSGNLVSNATWSDIWLNEGFTVYVEGRITEAIYGRRAQMEAVLGYQELQEELQKLPAKDQVLHIDLTGRDPDDGLSRIPYEKGALFLRHLESVFGRDVFDRFLKGYFHHFAFQSITTGTFEAYLQEHLLKENAAKAARISVRGWIHEAGLPSDAPKPRSDAFQRVEVHRNRWLKDGNVKELRSASQDWSTHEWLHFLRFLPKGLSQVQMAQLDKTFRLTATGNAEIAHQWLLKAIQERYREAYPRLETYLVEIGRRKLIKPLYEALIQTPEGKAMALKIYQKARPGYHPIAQSAVDGLLNWTPSERN